MAKRTIPGWRPGRDVCFIFSDDTAESRPDAELQAFVNAIAEVAGRYGFDLSMQGTRESFARYFHRFMTAEGRWRA